MQSLTRRDFGRFAGAAVGVALPVFGRAPIQSRFGGVILGMQCYSFRDRPLDAAIKAIADIGCGACEMNYMHFEPRTDREQLRQWRLTVPLDVFEKAGNMVREAGIDPWAYTYNMRKDFTDAEMARGFEMTRALGAGAICCSPTLSAVKRIDAMAQKYKVRVALHNHARVEPDELATPDDFAVAIKGASDYLGFALDLGHFVASGFDPLLFLRQHHAQILMVHIKDRKRDQGPNMPLGQGDTPIQEVLRFIRDGKYDIRADIEYEYKGQDTMVEVRKCFEYCKNALLT
jgi:sugar phosphate isomerase/epimerase